ncbi:MAG: hypothetical protein JXA67_08220, partial [Micromonosporaceae bacterium]|nr:hypothetical protein [Micromonosporaceae bacterium]
MQEWLQSVGLSLDEAEVLLAALAILGGMLAGLRQLGFHRITRSVTFWSHLADRSYSAWFARTWGRYDNPYLREIEDLDLRNTYVSLAFRGEEADERIDAGAVLGDRFFGNIVIEGDPGSGKSTLLRAYGVGASRLTAPGQVSGPPGRRGLSGPLGRSGAAARTRPAGHGPASGGRARTRPQAGRATPMLVPLRRFARTLTIPGRTLAGYLVSDILVSGWGRSPKDAEAFLRRSLATDRLV